MGIAKLEVCAIFQIICWLSWIMRILFFIDYEFRILYSLHLVSLIGGYREACQSALKEKHDRKFSEMEGFVDDLNDDYSKQLHDLEQVFDKASEADRPTEVSKDISISSTFPLIEY